MSGRARDVFIIHSKRDRFEKELAERVWDTLVRIRISAYEYDDWTWSNERFGKVRYASSGTHLDPARFVAGHPEPFRTRQREEAVDRQALEEMLAGSRAVLFIAPRSGTMSPGVREEYESLSRQCAVILATWGEHNDRLVDENRHAYVYRVTRSVDPDVETASLDLVHLVWLQWTLDFLARDGRDAGRRLLALLAQQDPAILRMIRLSGRVPDALKRKIYAFEGRERNRSAEPAAIASLGHSLAVEDARRVAACLWRQLSVRSLLDGPPSRSVASLLRGATHTFHWLGNAVRDRYPQLADEWAIGLQIGAAYAAGSAWGRPDVADRFLASALAAPDVSAAVRASLLADRAAISSDRSPEQALADINGVLALDGARGTSRSQALYLRARLHIRAGHDDDAIADLTAALAVPGASPLMLALCRQERATLRASSNEYTSALEDLDVALTIQGLPAIIVGPLQFDRGWIRDRIGDTDGAVQDYTRVLKLKNVPGDTRVRAQFKRGIARMARGDRNGATEDFIAVRDDAASPIEAVRGANFYLDELDPLKSPPSG